MVLTIFLLIYASLLLFGWSLCVVSARADRVR